MKRHILILAACACACAWAGVTSARLGSLGRNDTVVTNVTDVTPGNYQTVSNRAMTASNYTDAVAGTLRGKGDLAVYSYAPFLIYSYGEETFSPPMRMNYETIRYAGGGNETGWLSETQINGEFQLIYNDLTGVVYLEKSGGEYIVVSGNPITVSSDWKAITAVGATQVYIRRESTGIDFETGNRLATTNDIPRTPGAVGAYPAASGSALESGKQDRLPYPTNAIPYAAISGAPSGGQEWREVTVYTEAEEPVHFVTNGMMHVIHGATAAFTVQSAGWPNGAAIYVDWDYSASPIVQLPSNLRLVGYGTWPTNNFQSVWWRSGTNIFVNILLEE